jgi:hypothetical protein
MSKARDQSPEVYNGVTHSRGRAPLPSVSGPDTAWRRRELVTISCLRTVGTGTAGNLDAELDGPANSFHVKRRCSMGAEGLAADVTMVTTLRAELLMPLVEVCRSRPPDGLVVELVEAQSLDVANQPFSKASRQQLVPTSNATKAGGPSSPCRSPPPSAPSACEAATTAADCGPSNASPHGRGELGDGMCRHGGDCRNSDGGDSSLGLRGTVLALDHGRLGDAEPVPARTSWQSRDQPHNTVSPGIDSGMTDVPSLS